MNVYDRTDGLFYPYEGLTYDLIFMDDNYMKNRKIDRNKQEYCFKTGISTKKTAYPNEKACEIIIYKDYQKVLPIPEIPDDTEQLFFYNTRYDTLPKLPSKLKRFSIRMCELKHFYKELPPDLEELYVGGGIPFMKKIPKCISKLKNLKFLVLGGFQISNIKNLPQTLKWIQMRGSGIKTFPNDFPKNIETVYLAGNKIKKLPDLNQFKHLRYIRLEGNPIKKIDLNLIPIKQMEVIGLTDPVTGKHIVESSKNDFKRIREMINNI